ncbi:MAG: hypothetical protein U5L74_12050 [Ideonella sp.]|nr:hypothetical protein [Ideonella sp.]
MNIGTVLAMALWLLTSIIIHTAGPASRQTKPLRLMPVAAAQAHAAPTLVARHEGGTP